MSNNEKEEVNQLENIFNTIFSKTLVTIFRVLAIYFVLSNSIDITRNDGKNFYTKVANVIVLIVVFAYIFSSYYDLSKEQRENYATHLNESLKKFLKNSGSLLETGLFGLILYGLAFIRLGTNDTQNPSSINVLMTLTIIVCNFSDSCFYPRNIEYSYY